MSARAQQIKINAENDIRYIIEAAEEGKAKELEDSAAAKEAAWRDVYF